MGYSVYIVTSQEEHTLLKEAFSEQWIESLGKKWLARSPQFTSEDLSYIADPFKGKLLFGIDYGDYYMGTAVVATVAQLLGRDEYLYDTLDEIHKPSAFFWWREPKSTRKWDLHRKVSYRLSKSYFNKVDKFCGLIRQRFQETTTP